MKVVEKNQALTLRAQGKSIKEISRELKVAKSSVSLWVRSVELTDDQKKYLKEKGLFREKIERTRKTRLANEKYKRDILINKAMNEVPELGDKQLWLIGIMLYWGEGGKTGRSVRFSNSDPDVIKMMMLFFRKICNSPEEKFRGYIHIHEHLDYKAAERYWSDITGIPLSRFYKTYRKQNKASLGKKDSLPYGTLDLYVFDTFLFYKIVGWARGISSRLLDEPSGGFRALKDL
ncbi:MAG TPA: helix-turn-helix domain-containing protein [Candidatus Saccharimonadales bacterium]